MMKLKKVLALLSVFFLGILITTDVNSASDSIKQRMIDRLPVIKALKDQELSGKTI